MHWPPSAEDFARLRETLVWVAERSPYYRRAFDAAGVRPADLHTYDDFRTRVPRTEKTDLAANQRARPPFGEFLAVPREEIASLHTSPGRSTSRVWPRSAAGRRPSWRRSRPWASSPARSRT